jgi:tRNA (guanine26-N2/guanine27-N2)-dimethyltransferase
MSIITEQSTKINVSKAKIVSSKMEVFYNPLMESNRNISILLLNAIKNKKMSLALPLAGSGIRAIRFLRELKKSKIDQLFVNDKKENFAKIFESNLKLNKIKETNKIKIKNDEANLFLMNQHQDDFCGYFDYIDLDPFGSPNPFLSAAVARIKRNGIIAVTATDTAALSGTYQKVTKRKYWAVSLRNYLMHETGLRILIRKVQLLGVQFDKALTPVLAYHKDHYFRVYFRSENGKEKCDQIIGQHQYLLHCPKCLNYKTSNYNKESCDCQNNFIPAGPLWTGKLFDQKLLNKMVKLNKFASEKKFLELLNKESSKDMVGFHDLHTIGKKYKLATPQMEPFLKKVNAVRTHFSKNGFKCDKNIKEIIKKIKK